MTRTFAAVAASTAAVFLAGTTAVVLMTREAADPFGPCRTSEVGTGAASIGGPFQLIDSQGRAVTEADVLDRPALVYFGYTFCPDICPFDMSRNVEAAEILSARGLEVRPVFISVDPDRDTPAALADWEGAFAPGLVALTGSSDAIRAAALAYKVYYNVPAHSPDEEFYPVDHTTFTYLMLPGAGFVDLFRRDASADAMAATTACFLEHAPDAV